MKTYKWTVEFEVADCWVADGFDLNDDDAKEMLLSSLPFAYGEEVRAKVVQAPDPAEIRREQGYDDTPKPPDWDKIDRDELAKENAG